MSEHVEHPMQAWARSRVMSISDMAAAAACSETHLRNVLGWRKGVSLGLAHRLSKVTGGEVPFEAFVKPDEVRT